MQLQMGNFKCKRVMQVQIMGKASANNGNASANG